MTSLAGSTSGSIIGLNDLRTLGVPYDGQNTAVAVIDTGVDANSAAFRGRVADGTNVVTNGCGNQDTAPGTVDHAPTAPAPTTGAGANGTSSGQTTVTTLGPDGHGTLVAGVVAQFVPQATIEPVNVFDPIVLPFIQSTARPRQPGPAPGPGPTPARPSQRRRTPPRSSQYVWKGLELRREAPVRERPRAAEHRRTAWSTTAVMGFGTTSTFASEGTAYKQFPQIVLAFKDQLERFRQLGIAPVAAAGQFGAPYLAGVSAGPPPGRPTRPRPTGTNGQGNNNVDNASVGDDNGMSLPAVLNEVVSVTGTIPFPFAQGPATPPTDPNIGVVPRPPGPILIYGSSTIGGVPSTGTGTGTTGTTTNGTTTAGNNLALLTNG